MGMKDKIDSYLQIRFLNMYYKAAIENSES